MVDVNRTEDRLTTADIATKSSSPAVGSQVQRGIARENDEPRTPLRPTVVRNETANSGDWDKTPATTSDQNPRDTDVGTALFSDSDIGDLRSRWSNVQAEFVDEPRRAVQEADQLVATVMQRLAEGFANERGSLEKQWDSGQDASTEDLRMALQRYRAFFNRLLNAA